MAVRCFAFTFSFSIFLFSLDICFRQSQLLGFVAYRYFLASFQRRFFPWLLLMLYRELQQAHVFLVCIAAASLPTIFHRRLGADDLLDNAHDDPKQ